MPRTRTTSPLSRAELLVLVKQHLERAGSHGLTKQELVDAIGPANTSLATVQRVLDDLRSDAYEAQISSYGKIRRWRFEAPLSIPLEAPDRDDLLAVLIAQAILEPLVDPPLRERLGKLVEDLDDRARTRGSTTDLPSLKAMTSSLTLGTRIDPEILRRLLAACRRKTVRIRYASPWQPVADDIPSHEIEPWALRVHDGAVYLRAWVIDLEQPRTFRLAHIESVDDVTTTTASRQPIPADLWGEESPAFGIDRDRPGTAVIRLRGAVARWVARIVWHPDEKDIWIEPGELLERTVAYRSCREMARRLASVLDGVESIAPVQLRDEVVRLVARAAEL